MSEPEPENTEPRTGYKAFDKNLQCRGFQYEVGQTYRSGEPPVPCQSGFHFCDYALDVLDHYPVDSRFAVVRAGGTLESGCRKSVCSELSVVQELGIGDLIEAFVKQVGSKAVSSGDNSTAVSSGDNSKAASSGDYSTAASSGCCSKAASSGGYSKAALSGDHSKAASSGDHSKAASSGHGSKAASSGYNSTAASFGYGSKAASSGYYSKAASFGDRSKAASSGDHSTATCGRHGYAAAAGVGGAVSGGEGSALAVGCIVDGKRTFAVGTVGEDGILPGVLYKADTRGRLVPAKETP